MESMERHVHLDLDPRVRQRLVSASAATLDRLLQTIRTPAIRRLRRRRNQSPIGMRRWQAARGNDCQGERLKW